MAKANSNLWFKLVALVIVLLGAAVAYGLLSGNVAQNSEDIDKIIPEVRLNTEVRKETQTDIKWIKGSLERIEDKLP